MPIPNLPTLKGKQQDTEELVKNEELPEPQDREVSRESQGIPGRTPAVLTTPATLPVEGATTTESKTDSAAVHIGQINPGEYFVGYFLNVLRYNSTNQSVGNCYSYFKASVFWIIYGAASAE